ncbi:hypothetical protein [Streptomyces sp. NPDC021356]|uniref:hypothetical protein n=1 Tax=Streptomyces sp. NPDC021356 TaxID=3154900 RepID=UPI0033DCB8D7
MTLMVQPLLGVAAAIAIGTPAPLGPAATPATAPATAPAVAGAHCDRAEQDVWYSGPSRNVTARRCSIPSHKKRWYTVEVGTLARTYYWGDTPAGGVDRTRALHNRTIRCLGYTTDTDTDTGTVNWFGCPPD